MKSGKVRFRTLRAVRRVASSRSRDCSQGNCCAEYDTCMSPSWNDTTDWPVVVRACIASRTAAYSCAVVSAATTQRRHVSYRLARVLCGIESKGWTVSIVRICARCPHREQCAHATVMALDMRGPQVLRNRPTDPQASQRSARRMMICLRFSMLMPPSESVPCVFPAAGGAASSRLLCQYRPMPRPCTPSPCSRRSRAGQAGCATPSASRRPCPPFP